MAEGTKELMPNENNPTRLLLDPGAGRVPFALYSSRANLDYRLYIHIENPATERIYFGLGQQRNSNNNVIQTQITWRIHPPDQPDIEECLGQTPLQNTLPAPPDTGFISTYQEAFAGPNMINPGGYNPRVCIPTHGIGDYFMTFQATATRTFDFFDICVVNIAATPPIVIPGRVFSKCWQIRNPPNGPSWYPFDGDLFIYSNDGIVTKLDPNGMEARDFSISFNESGCYPIAPPYNAQQARQSQVGPNPHMYPQYKIFLNDPDPVVYLSGIIGQLVFGSVNAVPSCSTGMVTFNYQTEPIGATGTVEVILSLSTLTPPMVDRFLIQNNVPAGLQSVVWDGLDGAGIQVPSGSTFPFSLQYSNGLTHMPIWDVENNINGFLISLIRPILSPPLATPAFYWDDILVGGTQLTGPPGCYFPSSCHSWTNGWGDQKTINTWWYLVSSSTSPSTVTYLTGSGTITTIAPLPPQNRVCPGGSLTFTVTTDPGAIGYQWNWGFGNQITPTNTFTLTIPSGTLPATYQMSVFSINPSCGNSLTNTIPFEVLQLPSVNGIANQTVCNGTNTIPVIFSGNMPGTIYSWTNSNPSIGLGMSGTGNIPAFTATNAGTAIVTATITITPTANGCAGTQSTYTITVNPTPTVNVIANQAYCNFDFASATIVNGTVAGSSFSWTNSNTSIGLAANGTGNIPGFYVTNTTPVPQIATIMITPSFTHSGVTCFGAPTSFIYTVNPLPTATITGTTIACLNSSAPMITFTGGHATPPYTFTYNINNGINQFITTTVGNSIAIPAPTNIAGTYVYNLISVIDGSFTSCSQLQMGSATVTISTFPVSLSIATSTNPVCQGTLAIFTATPVNGGTAPVFQWKVNGANVGTNSLTFSYVPINGDIITCHLTSNGTCLTGNPAISNSISMIVSSSIPVIIGISASSNPVCQGSAITFSATIYNGGTNPFYQWRVNGNNVGLNNSTFNYTPFNGDIVTCWLTSTLPCASGSPASSNPITMTVNQMQPVSVSISPSENPTCVGTPVSFYATPVNGGTFPTYLWKVNGNNLGSNNATFTYLPVNGDVVTCLLTSNYSCSVGNPTSSNSVVMNVGQSFIAGVNISASSNPAFQGQTVTFTATQANGGSSPAYQWLKNGFSVGTNSSSYSCSPIDGDLIMCLMTSSLTCASGNPAISNPIYMNVYMAAYRALENIIVTNGQNNCYNAGQTISVAGNGTSFLIENGGSATMIAGQNILFHDGTNIQSGGKLWGYIAPSGPFCQIPSMPAVIASEDEEVASPEGNFFKVYPNPTTGNFILELIGDTEQVKVDIYGIWGEKILTTLLIGEHKHEFSLSDKPAGVYFFRVITGDKSETAKIIKQ